MRYKKITPRTEMSQKISQGIEQISSIVGRTLGPGGMPVLIERVGQALNGEPLAPMITKDGVTVASECSDPDPEIDLVIQTVKAICQQTNKVAGDGTTQSIVLANAILQESLRVLENDASLNPQLVRESVESVAGEVPEMIEKLGLVKKIDSLDTVEQVAAISANGDTSVAKVIRDAFEAVGHEGVITVDEGHSPKTTLEIVDGFQIRRGAEAQERFFNNQHRTKFEAENAHVILYDGRLDNYTLLLPALNTIAEQNRKGLPPIVVVANDFTAEVIQFLLIQRAELGLSVCAVRSPHVTNVRTSMLEDMAIMLGGEKLGNGSKNLQSATFDDIGVCDRVVVDKYTATFYGGHGEESEVIERIDGLKEARTLAESPFDAQLISDRIGALSQGVAKIGVGGSTDLEIKERYHRIEDALNAARAAVEAGVIPGGCTTLYRVAKKLSRRTDVGSQILAKAFREPFRLLVSNIGLDPDEYCELLDKKITTRKNVVFDARHKKFVEAFSAGIIDPFKVTKTALQNAVSISALLSTCGGGLTYLRKD